jgi:hypothetical protein
VRIEEAENLLMGSCYLTLMPIARALLMSTDSINAVILVMASRRHIREKQETGKKNRAAMKRALSSL